MKSDTFLHRKVILKTFFLIRKLLEWAKTRKPGIWKSHPKLRKL